MTPTTHAKPMTPRQAEDFSPAQAAAFLGKSRQFIIALIEKGDIEATDERSPDSHRPYYRIARAACVDWKLSRRVVPKTVPDLDSPRGVSTGLLHQRRQRRAAKRARQVAAHARG